LKNKDREPFKKMIAKGNLTMHDLILMPLKLFILEIWKEIFEKGKS
jgi:hypothetical protein